MAGFLASLVLIIAGEERTPAVIERIEERIEDGKAGTFPAPNITR